MRSFTFETQKKSFSEPVGKTEQKAEKPYLLIRTRYPVFSPCEDGEKEKPSEKRFCEKINRFYAESAERFASDVPPKDRKKAIFLAEKSQKPCSFVWHTEVPFNGKELLSVFTDISGFDGENTVKRRFCALWSVSDGSLLMPKKVFFTGAKQRKNVVKMLCDIAESNARRGIFTYYDNFAAIINKHFSFDSFYFVPNGAAFYFDGGLLSPRTEEVTVFVAPFEKLDGILKIVPEQ